MSWSETHRRLAALRAVEAELNTRGDGRLPWNEDYADIFGGEQGLLLALRYRWALMVEAQVEEPFDASGMPSRDLTELAARHPGLLAALRRNSRRSAAWQGRLEHAGGAR